MTSPNAAPDELVERCVEIITHRKPCNSATLSTCTCYAAACAIIRLAQAAQAKEFAEWCEARAEALTPSWETDARITARTLRETAKHARAMEKAND